MNSFLRRVTDELWEQHQEAVSELWVVLPTRRAGLFFKDCLSQSAGKPLVSPQLFTFSEFTQELTGLDIPDGLSNLFRLYEIYREMNGSESESFDRFARWGRLLLGDFDDIHRHLLDPGQVFTNLRAVRNVENWSLSEEELSEGQERYLAFYDQFLEYHDRFTADLWQRNSALDGRAVREAAENTEQYLDQIPARGVVFAGFNALPHGEQEIITKLIRAGKGRIFWDADRYYVDNPVQEAGLFIRQYRKKWDLPFDRLDNHLGSTEKDIKLIGVPGQIGQAKVAGDLLRSMDSSQNFRNTIVALSDEQLLLPMLNSLPEEVNKVNVTMGYPLKYTALQSLFDGIFNLHENARRLARPGQRLRFYHQDVLKILHHPAIRRYCHREGHRNISDQLVRHIVQQNKVFLNFEDLEQAATELKRHEEVLRLRFLFEHLKKVPGSLLKVLSTLIDLLKDTYLGNDRAGDKLELEYLYHYYKVLKRLQSLLSGFAWLEEIRSFRSLFNQIASNTGLSFYGEPLRGLQVMGMLETRAVDFETVILLGANENTLPAARNDRSFIPYDLRRHFNLPTHLERDAIFAYSFYRLLQRAKRIFILYNTETDDFGSGERSRFITQLVHELPRVNPKIKLEDTVMSIPVAPRETPEFEVKMTPQMQEKLRKLFASGLSPTALTTYINCPLNFYYKYLLGLNERKEVEEEVEVSSFGTFVHQTLETFFTPFVGKSVTVADLENMLPRIEAVLEERFADKYGKEEIQSGKNHLLFKVAATFLNRFLVDEKAFVEKAVVAGDQLQIVGLEEELRTELDVILDQKVTKVNLRGEADRIDHTGGRTRIIDYKTGKVYPRDLRIENLNESTHVPRYHKCFQVLMYALLYRRNHPEARMPLQSGIVSFRNLNEGLMNISISKSEELDDKTLNDFEEELRGLVKRMYDPEQVFKHNPESTWCAFCHGH